MILLNGMWFQKKMEQANNETILDAYISSSLSDDKNRYKGDVLRNISQLRNLLATGTCNAEQKDKIIKGISFLLAKIKKI